MVFAILDKDNQYHVYELCDCGVRTIERLHPKANGASKVAMSRGTEINLLKNNMFRMSGLFEKTDDE